MKVTATGIDAQLRTNGIDLQIRNTGGKLVGTLHIGKAQIEWHPAWAKKSFKGQALAEFITQHLDKLPDLKK
jgi:uncharacterized protein YbaP (TraB family)